MELNYSLKNWSTFLILLSVLTNSNLFASNTEAAKNSSLTKKYESVESDPLEARIYTLENGLKVYLSVNTDEPRIETAIPVRVGCKQDPRQTTGLAHYLEHMLFKGTDQIGSTDWEKEKVLLEEIEQLYEAHLRETDPEKKQAIYKKIDSTSYIASNFVAASEYDKMVSLLGAKGTNAYTSTDQTVYINNIPSNELERWLQLESERFRMVVLRLFHTELEAVYEEFNMSQDRDGSKVYRAMLENLFPNHPYRIPTIGVGEHLKNPSLLTIKKFFQKYYVANNMAICLSGDFDPDKTITLIEKYFGSLRSQEINKWIKVEEEPIEGPIVAEVTGNEPAYVSLVYRFDGAGSEDAMYLKLMDGVFQNGSAGIMDLNLLQTQKILDGGSYQYNMGDYSMHIIQAYPREGQSLEEVKDLILEQIELLKKGEFEDWLIEAILKDYKLAQIRGLESNRARSRVMVNAFVHQLDWNDVVNTIPNLEKLSKEDIVGFANKNYKDNYVVVYKHQGENASVLKMQKPPITPVEMNRGLKSDFFEEFVSQEASRLEPVFINYEEEIKSVDLPNGLKTYYTHNPDNELFSLYYILDIGTDHNKKLGLAIQYLPYLGTNKYTAAQLQQEFYRLGLSFDVYSSDDQIYVFLRGLEESLDEGMALFEHLLENVQPDEKALQNLIEGTLKERLDGKANRRVIFNSAMVNYGKYGPENPFTNIIPEEELKSIKAEELTDLIHHINDYEHYVYYYGQMPIKEVEKMLMKHHSIPKSFIASPEKTVYPELETEKNRVLFVNYDMVQANILMLNKGETFNKEIMPYSAAFAEYFGGGMSSIVFQEIREKRALAYSAFAGLRTPAEKDDSHYLTGYMAVQADKMGDAIIAMQDLLTEMPKAETQFNNGMISAQKKIETERITKTSKFFNYLKAQDRGLDYDIRKDIYESAKTIKIDDLEKFFNKYISGKTFTYLVIGNKADLDMEYLKSLGEFKEVSLEELFGF